MGGARGIGRAVVSAFLAEGATVHSADLLESEHRDESPFTSSQLDASDPSAMAAFCGSVLAAEGHVDVLINNVGVHLPKSVIDATPDEFDRIFRINVKPIYLACHELLPQMLDRRRGSIVNVSSNGGMMGRPGDPLYNASKHAIIGLTKSLAVAYSHLGVRVNAVCPGAIDTAMLRGSIPAGGDFASMLPAYTASTPMARVAKPEEVAATILFLATDEAPFISGAAIAIDGAKSAGAMPNDRYRMDHALNTSYD